MSRPNSPPLFSCSCILGWLPVVQSWFNRCGRRTYLIIFTAFFSVIFSVHPWQGEVRHFDDFAWGSLLKWCDNGRVQHLLLMHFGSFFKNVLKQTDSHVLLFMKQLHLSAECMQGNHCTCDSYRMERASNFFLQLILKYTQKVTEPTRTLQMVNVQHFFNCCCCWRLGHFIRNHWNASLFAWKEIRGNKKKVRKKLVAHFASLVGGNEREREVVENHETLKLFRSTLTSL